MHISTISTMISALINISVILYGIIENLISNFASGLDEVISSGNAQWSACSTVLAWDTIALKYHIMQ